MSLSVVLVTFNEASNIERCLQSVYDIADEIILIDGGSTDNTVALVKKLDTRHKIKITHTNNPQNFHINKKKGIEKATGDWILQIDADEELSDGLKKEIPQIISQESAKDGYWIPRLNFFMGQPLRKGGQYPDKTLRLYKRGKGMLPAQDVHEQALVSGLVRELHHDLLHYPYPSFQVYLNKWIRYAIFEAEKVHASGKKLSFVQYCIVKPKLWFLKTYFRHKGFQDGLPGFVFSLFSALRFVAIYAIVWERQQK